GEVRDERCARERGRLTERGRRTSPREPATEPGHNLHHQPFRNISVTELIKRRRSGRRTHESFSRAYYAFSIQLRTRRLGSVRGAASADFAVHSALLAAGHLFRRQRNFDFRTAGPA